MPRQRRREVPRDSVETLWRIRDDSSRLFSKTTRSNGDSILYLFLKLVALSMIFLVVFIIPLGDKMDIFEQCDPDLHCVLCNIYVFVLRILLRVTAIVEIVCGISLKVLRVTNIQISLAYSEDVTLPMPAVDEVNKEVDKVIEDEITSKLSRDLAQSIEKKFHVDLEKSVNMVLLKIQMLLQNGTTHIMERLSDLQAQLEDIRKSTGTELEKCLKRHENETAQLAEKAMHQMVVCGYALIGHNPTQAVGAVVSMKNMIKTRLQPVRTQKKELDELLKVCGHEHDSLKKVIKCVIAKSPVVKSAMMDVTTQLLQGVVELTKVLAHGAMHEACLIEVIKTVEDEAFLIVTKVRDCAFGNITAEANKYLQENNATVLDVPPKKSRKLKIDTSKREVVEMKQLLRRMLDGASTNDLDRRFMKKLKKLQEDLKSGETNVTEHVGIAASNASVDLNATSIISNVISNNI